MSADPFEPVYKTFDVVDVLNPRTGRFDTEGVVAEESEGGSAQVMVFPETTPSLYSVDSIRHKPDEFKVGDRVKLRPTTALPKLGWVASVNAAKMTIEVVVPRTNPGELTQYVIAAQQAATRISTDEMSEMSKAILEYHLDRAFAEEMAPYKGTDVAKLTRIARDAVAKAAQFLEGVEE